MTSIVLCDRVDTNETATSELEKEHESHSTEEMIVEEEEEGETAKVSSSTKDEAEKGSSSTSTADSTFKAPQAPQVGRRIG